MDCSPPGSSFHGILQARIWEWVATPSSTGSSRPRNWTLVSCVSCTWQADSLPLVPDPNSGSPGLGGASRRNPVSTCFPPSVSALISSDLSRAFPFVLTQHCVLKGIYLCVSFAFNILFSTSALHSGGSSGNQPALRARTKSKLEHLYNRL